MSPVPVPMQALAPGVMPAQPHSRAERPRSCRPRKAPLWPHMDISKSQKGSQRRQLLVREQWVRHDCHSLRLRKHFFPSFLVDPLSNDSYLQTGSSHVKNKQTNKKNRESILGTSSRKCHMRQNCLKASSEVGKCDLATSLEPTNPSSFAWQLAPQRHRQACAYAHSHTPPLCHVPGLSRLNHLKTMESANTNQPASCPATLHTPCCSRNSPWASQDPREAGGLKGLTPPPSTPTLCKYFCLKEFAAQKSPGNHPSRVP